jgi:hypothetical protein
VSTAFLYSLSTLCHILTLHRVLGLCKMSTAVF